jgi:hypothetical protein
MVLVGQEDSLRDQVALAGERKVLVAQVPPEPVEEGRAFAPSEPGHRPPPRTTRRR